jgi:hypothetical protein
MDPFRRFAAFTLARDASCVAFTAAMLMLAFSFAPAVAFGIGANLALIFSIVLGLRALFLTDQRLLQTEVWRVLEPGERPQGEAEQQRARDELQELLLRFAKSAAALAIGLYSSSLVSSLRTQDPAQAFVTASLH